MRRFIFLEMLREKKSIYLIFSVASRFTWFSYLKMVSCSEILIHRLPVERLVFLFASNWHSNVIGNIHWILLCFCWQVLDYPWQNLPTNFLVSKQKVKQAALRPNRRHTCYIRNTWIPPKSSPVNSGDVALVSHWDIIHL